MIIDTFVYENESIRIKYLAIFYNYCHFFRILVAIRETAMDLSANLMDNPNAAIKKERDPKTGFLLNLPKRPVGPSTTQVLV